jgi:cell division protein FtsB
MSAMPARTPRVNPIPTRTKRLSRLAFINPRVIVTPISQAIPVAIPSGRASRNTFIAVNMGMILFGSFLLLLVHTQVQQTAFEKQTLQNQLNQMIATEQQLASEVATAESTDNLDTAARTLGMVPAETPVFIRLSDQTVIGQAVPAKAPLVPFTPLAPVISAPVIVP